MKRNRVNIRVTDEIWFQLKAATEASGATMTSIIETAINTYFDPDYAGVDDLLMKRMDRFDERQGRLEADTRLCAETLGQFVFYWLTHTEQIPEGERDSANALGRRRYEYFTRQVAEKI